MDSDIRDEIDNIIFGYVEHGLICREALEAELLRSGYKSNDIEEALNNTRGLCSADGLD